MAPPAEVNDVDLAETYSNPRETGHTDDEAEIQKRLADAEESMRGLVDRLSQGLDDILKEAERRSKIYEKDASNKTASTGIARVTQAIEALRADSQTEENAPRSTQNFMVTLAWTVTPTALAIVGTAVLAPSLLKEWLPLQVIVGLPLGAVASIFSKRFGASPQ